MSLPLKQEDLIPETHSLANNYTFDINNFVSGKRRVNCLSLYIQSHCKELNYKNILCREEMEFCILVKLEFIGGNHELLCCNLFYCCDVEQIHKTMPFFRFPVRKKLVCPNCTPSSLRNELEQHVQNTDFQYRA